MLNPQANAAGDMSKVSSTLADLARSRPFCAVGPGRHDQPDSMCSSSHLDATAAAIEAPSSCDAHLVELLAGSKRVVPNSDLK